MSNPKQDFLNHINKSIELNQFVKLVISNRRAKKNDLKSIHVKLISIKSGLKLSFTYRHETKDITKNYEISEGIQYIDKALKSDFYQADLFTTQADYHIKIDTNDKEKLTKTEPTIIEAPDLHHDKIKTRIITKSENSFLTHLGISNPDGSVKKDMNDKYKQINKYVEIVDSIIRSSDIKEEISIVDMGCGKGYLTFALYDYLKEKTDLKPRVSGVELRQELVDYCNKISGLCHYEDLKFQPGSIANANLENIDMLIALHACDTATDEAIFKGIEANARVIVCAPCCHKQIRGEMKPENALKNVTQYGILLERQAEIITDTLRALILKAHGYKTNVFEFISTEHTPKNVLIVGVKKGKTSEKEKQETLKEIKDLKELFGIKKHYLEKLMGI